MSAYEWLLFGLTDELGDWLADLAREYRALLFLVRRGDGLLQPLLMPRHR